jgi:hypothetical protein
MDPAIVRGKVDFGIITIRDDEFTAALDKFPEEIGIVSGRPPSPGGAGAVGAAP